MKRLYKSNNKIISGVCGGIAEFFDMDPTVVRLAFIFLMAVAGLSIWTYILAAIVMPSAPSDYYDSVDDDDDEDEE